MPANQSTLEVTRADPAVEKYGPLSILPVSPTSEQRDLIRASDFYKLGDARLAWVNEGDLSCLLLEQAYIEMAPEWSAIMTAKGYSGTISEALSMLPDRNTRIPARGGDELREYYEATEALIVLNGFGPDPAGFIVDWASDHLDDEDQAKWDRFCDARDAVRAALASTDMAGAGERADRRELDRLLADWRKSLANPASWLDRLRAFFAAPPVEGLTSGEGEPVAWCSPGQLANLTDVDRDGGVYLPIRKTRRGNFTMPLYAASPKATATASVREGSPQQEIPLFSTMPNDAVVGRARCDIQRGQAITAVMIGNVSDSGTAATIGGERAC